MTDQDSKDGILGELGGPMRLDLDLEWTNGDENWISNRSKRTKKEGTGLGDL